MDEQSIQRITRSWGVARDDLDRLASRLRSYVRLTCETLRDIARGQEFRFRPLEESRVKPLESVLRVLTEADDIWQIDDMVGARAVVVTPSDAKRLADFIMADSQAPLKELQLTEVDDVSGYKAIHLKGVAESTFGSVGCEIQIRTALQDTWAVISRADVYGRTDLPAAVVEMLQIVSQHLAAADQSLELVRREASRAEVPEELPIGPRISDTDQLPDWIPTEERSAEEQRREDDEFVLRSSVSDERKQAFLANFLEDRAKAATLETLFARVEQFRRAEEPNDTVSAGILALLRKGPFVEGSRWLPYRTWPFAVASERHLLDRFGHLLHRTTEPRFITAVAEQWDDILAGVGALWEDLKRREYEASAVVITGQLQPNLLIESHVHLTPTWELPEDLQGPWIIGAVGVLPVLHLRDLTIPGLFVVDMGRFASLTKYGPDAEFSVEDFSETRARELIDQNPDLVRLPEGAPDTTEERLRQLQLHVGLRLYESLGLEVNDPQAVAKAELRPA